MLSSGAVPIHALPTTLSDNPLWPKIRILLLQVLVQDVSRVPGLNKDQDPFLSSIWRSVHLIQVLFEGREPRGDFVSILRDWKGFFLFNGIVQWGSDYRMSGFQKIISSPIIKCSVIQMVISIADNLSPFFCPISNRNSLKVTNRN